MKKSYRVYQVDSFTKETFKGNPAGVVPDANGLTDEQMQKIARELNNSETAFILNPTSPDHDTWIRFFTPSCEVPICGHATIAAHYIRATENQLGPCTVVQRTGAGNLPVEIIKDNEDYKIKMTQGAISFSEVFNSNVVLTLTEALGIKTDDLLEKCPVQIVSTGHSKVIIGIRDEALLNSLNPNMNLLAELSSRIGCNGYFVFAFNNTAEKILTSGRMFAPAIGINEDPVTGNANGPLGAYLVKHRLVQHDAKIFNFTGKQGEVIDRKGTIDVEVIIEKNEPKQINISGSACIVFQTELKF